MNPITIHRKDGDQKTGIMDRLRRRRQIKKLVKKLEKTSDYLERLMIEARIEGLRWKSKDSGKKVTD
jgi:sensor histidine kinase regulating citrate/malate metabolism